MADWQSEQRERDERLAAGSKFAAGKMVAPNDTTALLEAVIRTKDRVARGCAGSTMPGRDRPAARRRLCRGDITTNVAFTAVRASRVAAPPRLREASGAEVLSVYLMDADIEKLREFLSRKHD